MEGQRATNSQNNNESEKDEITSIILEQIDIYKKNSIRNIKIYLNQTENAIMTREIPKTVEPSKEHNLLLYHHFKKSVEVVNAKIDKIDNSIRQVIERFPNFSDRGQEECIIDILLLFEMTKNVLSQLLVSNIHGQLYYTALILDKELFNEVLNDLRQQFLKFKNNILPGYNNFDTKIAIDMRKIEFGTYSYNMFNIIEKVDANLYVSSTEYSSNIQIDIMYLFDNFTYDSLQEAFDIIIDRSKRRNYPIQFTFSTNCSNNNNFDIASSLIKLLLSKYSNNNYLSKMMDDFEKLTCFFSDKFNYEYFPGLKNPYEINPNIPHNEFVYDKLDEPCELGRSLQDEPRSLGRSLQD
jgi:hypothetical protein